MRQSRKKTLITEQDIEDIIKDYENGTKTQTELMKEYKLPQIRLKRILNRQEQAGGYKSRTTFTAEFEELTDRSVSPPPLNYITHEELDQKLDDFLVKIVEVMKELNVVK